MAVTECGAIQYESKCSKMFYLLTVRKSNLNYNTYYDM